MAARSSFWLDPKPVSSQEDFPRKRRTCHVLGYLKGKRILSSLESLEDGSFSLLEQSNSSGIWKVAPFHVPSLDKNLKIPSYTCLAQLKDDAGAPLAQKKVLLTSSSWGNATVNGQMITVDSDGVELGAVAGGLLNTIIPVSDISRTYQATIISTSLFVSFITQDSIKLGNISVTQLREAKTSDGTLLLVNPKVRIQTSKMPQKPLQSCMDWAWRTWNYIKEKIKDVEYWIIDKMEDTWHFIVLRVLETIGAAFKKLFDWLSFIFGWGDVLETMDVVDGMLTFGEKSLIDQAAPALTHFFEKIKAPTEEAKNNLLQKVKDTQASPKEADTQDEYVKKVQGARNSVPANWSTSLKFLLHNKVITINFSLTFPHRLGFHTYILEDLAVSVVHVSTYDVTGGRWGRCWGE
ncbi:hypothetical protein BYT27DRAFT_7214818 [Phlegmacium glaucopus]|nr:hypothetical protein BYT27DRAFT_7214818 [Phlegmacium glaucopus]